MAWTDAAGAISGVVGAGTGIAALTVTLRDRNQRKQQALAEQASRVWVFSERGASGTLSIEGAERRVEHPTFQCRIVNNSDLPVLRCRVEIWGTHTADARGHVTVSRLEPNAIANRTISVSGQPLQDEETEAELTFEDAAHQRWQRHSDGRLVRLGDDEGGQR